MSWTNPPTKITEARDRLLETAAIQALFSGLSLDDQQARCHYPDADALNDTFPYLVLSRVEERYRTVAAGASMGDGEIEGVICLDDTVSIGTAEQLIDVPKQLTQLRTEGLFVIEARATRSSEITSAMEAGADSTADVGRKLRTVTVAMMWEG